MISITSVKRIAKKRAAGKFLAAFFWLGLWELLSRYVKQDILLVSPFRVCKRMLELAGQSDFWISAACSMERILFGFCLAVIVGTVLTAAASAVPLIHSLFQPAVSVMKATPVASFIILALVWLKSRQVPVFASFLMVLPLLWSNIGEGIGKTDPNLLEMAKAYRFSAGKIVRRIYIPSITPYFMAACTAGMGLAWKAGVAAEVLANTRFSIGGHIYSAKIYIETEDLFAWTAVVIIMSVLLEHFMLYLMRAAAEKYGMSGAAE